MGMHVNAFGGKRRFKGSTPTQEYSGYVNGVFDTTRATSDAQAKRQLKIKFNQRRGYQNNAYCEVTDLKKID